MAAAPKLVLHFFNIGGRGRAIRIALALGNLPYEDRRYTYDEFERRQTAGEWPFGAVPALDVDGERLAQSCTLLRYVGKLAGLYPEAPLAAARCDMAVDAMEEMINAIGRTIFLEQNAKLVARAQLATVEVPRLFGPFEKRLAASPTGFIAGTTGSGMRPDGLSIGDIALFGATAWLTSGHLDGIDAATLFSDFPAVRTLTERVRALPEVAALEATYE